ncbi:MAG: MMPL family transporter [Pirellulales bacterium]|nr:MMPL family transporter [Pirellulales bacterium]
MFMDRVVELFGRHRGVVALCIVLYTAAAAWGNARLGFDDVPRSVFRTADDDFVELEKVFADFGSDDNDCVVVIEPAGEGDPSGDLFTPERIAALRAAIASLQTLEGVDEVRSLADVVVVDPVRGGARSLLPHEGEPSREAFAAARAAAVAHPMIVGQVLSPDARTALAIVRLEGNSLSIGDIEPHIARLRGVLDQVNAQGVLRLRLTGVPPIRVEIFRTVQRESSRFIVIGAILGFGMATLLFRRFWAVMIVASAPILGSFWTLGTLGLIGEKLNVINTVLPTLVLVVGFADSVHLMHDIRRSVASGKTPLEAAKLTIRHLGPPCLLTSVTACVGFASLAVADLDVVRRFGLTCAMGALLSFCAVILVVPLLSSTALGYRLQPKRLPQASDWLPRAFDRLVDFLMRYPRSVTLAGLAATIFFSVIALQLRPDNRLTETIPPENESYQALIDCDRAFGGMLMAYALVEWPDDKELRSPEVIDLIFEVQETCRHTEGAQYPLSIVNLLQALPGQPGNLAARVPLLALAPTDVVQRFARPDLHKALVTVHLRDRGIAAHRPIFERLAAQFADIEARHPGMQVHLTGSVVVAGRNINTMIVDLVTSQTLADGVIFVAMMIGFRSLRYGLVAILPNFFPMAFTAAVLVMTGRPLQVTCVIVFSICIGIAVDDTIHFLARFRRELEVDGNVHEAIRRTFHAVGEAVVTTTLVLLVGFASVLTSEMPTSRLFAWLSCTAIGSALLGDLFILPAMLAWFVPARQRRAARQPSEASAVADGDTASVAAH